MIDTNIPQYLKIVDKRTNQTLVAGKVAIYKFVPKFLLSFDYAYFFSDEENQFFKILPNPEKEVIKFNPDKTDIKIELYRQVFENPKEYIYREFTLDELDVEIKDLVFILRDLGYCTTGSCCGHNLKQAWVDILFNDFESLLNLNKVIEHKFKDKFFLTTYSRHNNLDPKSIYFSLVTYNIGEEAYKDINELVNYLKLVLETKNKK